MLVVAVGVSVTDMSSRLMTSYGSAVLLFNTFLVSAVVTLVVHSGILMLKATVKASESIFLQLNKENKSSGHLNKTLVTRILYGVLAVSFLGSAIIFVPKFLGMFSVPNISSPLSIIIVILTAVFTAKIGINFHTSLNHVIRKTLLGADNTK
jgi:sterol desaturase/sphingolipid hydroxylase (fatty acid hydroxylase superfamily)|tara:strand:- start:3 stop:458 length:456 start_codon:yes stop_codon:yes gene_type:complete